jgi:hypothetical protein
MQALHGRPWVLLVEGCVGQISTCCAAFQAFMVHAMLAMLAVPTSTKGDIYTSICIPLASTEGCSLSIGRGHCLCHVASCVFTIWERTVLLVQPKLQEFGSSQSWMSGYVAVAVAMTVLVHTHVHVAPP